MAGRTFANSIQRRRDESHTTYREYAVKGDFLRLIDVDADVFPDDLIEILPRLAEMGREHIFDLLGSGPVEVRHGLQAKGLCGRRDLKLDRVSADAEGFWLQSRINPANLEVSQRIWRLIVQGTFAQRDYQPIDWQLDFKSGYRWSERTYWCDITIGPQPGADIKIPWELARMQHLPRLSLAAALASHLGQTEEARANASEVRAQVIDFIATNPPRFGVNWRCPMDVAIRAANILLSIDILNASGLNLDRPANDAIADSMADHARHILANLEWSEEARGNHYFADIGGLLFIAAYLPPTEWTDAVLAFAVDQLSIEVERQFLSDGGSFEGSTSYHRLTGEIALWCAALLLGLSDTRPQAFQSFNPQLLRVRPGMPRPPLRQNSSAHGAPLTLNTVERLHRIVEFTCDARRSDGATIQIGDNDSGQFFKIHLAPAEDGRENSLDYSSLLALGATILDRVDLAPDRQCLESQIADSLAKGRKLTESVTQRFAAARRTTGSTTDLQASLAQLDKLSDGQKRSTMIPTPSASVGGTLRTACYPEFGLYLWRDDRFSLSCRCAGPAAWLGGETGHGHDDNLSLDLMIEGRNVITDPGSFLYTPFPDTRRLYRGIESHFAPRPLNEVAAAEEGGLFGYVQCATAVCHYFGVDGFAGTLTGKNWTVMRVVLIGEDEISILDGCLTGLLGSYAVLKANHKISTGYGEKGDSPPCNF